MEMKRRRVFPVCAKCSTVMNPDLYDDVTPGFLVGGECYCPECFKEWAKDEIDSDPEAVAAAMGIAVLTILEG